MRAVTKDLDAIPASLIADNALEDLEKIAKLDDGTAIKDTIYKGTYKDPEGKTQSSVRDALNIYYHQKCAYCEDICKAEIEHYRPKKAVTEDSGHNGYYWLCYEWSNLLPSCRYCNTEGGKGNKFPLMNPGDRIFLPSFEGDVLKKTHSYASASPLVDERPFLLNPEIDRNYPSYFSFRINSEKTGIELLGIDEEERGDKTIRICNLNRSVLQLNRLEVFYNYRSKINQVFDLVASGQMEEGRIQDALFLVFSEINRESLDDMRKFTLLSRLIMSSTDNFEKIFSPYIENKNQREIAVEVFRNFKVLHI